MHRSFVSTVLVGLVLIYSQLCAFAQSNLRDPADEQRLIIAQQSDGSAANDRTFWDSVRDSKNPDELRAYLEQFPTGIFAPLARLRLKALETGGAQSQSGKTEVSTVTDAKEIARDGRFIAYDNGTVLDTKTSLMWASKDNGNDLNWADGNSYCKNYRGGGYTDWRMPKQDELARLYDISKSYKATQRSYNVYLTEFIQLSTCCPWVLETRGSAAGHFSLNSGKGRWDTQSSANFGRVLPVRSGR